MSTFEFGSTYSALTGEPVGSLYIPTVEHHDTEDILIDGGPTVSHAARFDVHSGWDAITGRTGQDGYRGAVMHPSETATDEQVREWVRDAGGDTFAIVEVSGHDDAEPVFPAEPDYCERWGCAHDPAGWAIIYRAAEVLA